MIESPVLLITFNRPDTTRIVFDAIRKARPATLYVFNDGPRSGNDADAKAREEIKKIINQVDWECDLSKNFPEKNFGCGPGVSGAISWVLQKEETCIILEDDCLPASSFFDFCQELLDRYKDNDSVWMISGDNYTEEFHFDEGYVFSSMAHHIWGWATWKRAWENYDISKEYFQKSRNNWKTHPLFATKKQDAFFKKRYWQFYNQENVTRTWDFQWNYIISINRGLTIVPAKNLVTNIGFDGSHTEGVSPFHNRPVDGNFKIRTHPAAIVPNNAYDELHFKNHWVKMCKNPLYTKVIRKIKKIVKK